MKSRSKSHQTTKVKDDTKFVRFLRLVKNNFGVAVSIGMGLINFLILITLGVTWLNQNGLSTPVQEYYINVSDYEDDTRFNCNLKEIDGILVCDNREVYGVFSKYDSIELLGAETDNDTFRLEFSYSVPRELYETPDFSIDNLPDEKEVSLLVGLHDKILDKILLSKEVKTIFKFSENDKNLISDTHARWQEEENKRQAEPETKSRQETVSNTPVKTEPVQEESNSEREVEQSISQEEKEKSEFPTEYTAYAMYVCGKKIGLKPGLRYIIRDSYWSGTSYVQIFKAEYPEYGGLQMTCVYHWWLHTALDAHIE